MTCNAHQYVFVYGENEYKWENKQNSDYIVMLLSFECLLGLLIGFEVFRDVFWFLPYLQNVAQC